MAIDAGDHLSFAQHSFMTTHNHSFHETSATPAERVWGRPALDEMRGFLPLRAPSIAIGQFNAVNELLKRMPIMRKIAPGKYSAGLLASNNFRHHAQSLPDLSLEITHYASQLSDEGLSEHIKDDIAFNCAMLFRDYQYLKMGYLFEPILHGASPETCLPENIALPLYKLAKLFDRHPWLEYASGYVIANSDYGARLSPHDIRLFRSWHGGPDEFYFQTVHAAMEWETPQLFSAINNVFLNIHTSNAIGIRVALSNGISTTQRMLSTLKLLPKLSRPAHYSADIYPQIQGLNGNTGHGKFFDARGVFFEGCGTQTYAGKHGRWISDIRGQTTSQSSILPLLDNALGIVELPTPEDNPLNSMLHAFQGYRPTPHVALLNRVKATQDSLSVRTTLKQVAPLQLAQFCHAVCQFREFHYYLTMAYIVKPGLNQQPNVPPQLFNAANSLISMYSPIFVQHSLNSSEDALNAVNTKSLTPTELRLYQQLRQDTCRMTQSNKDRATIVRHYLDGQEPESQLDIALAEAKALFFTPSVKDALLE